MRAKRKFFPDCFSDLYTLGLHSQIVIPSERNERGNLPPNSTQGDCHSRYAPSQ